MGKLASTVRAFTPLGWTSFGGPAAHLGYFRTEFVQRHGWLSDKNYADLVAMSQFLPGPASSKVGQAIGYHHAGWSGMAAAWFMFTFPSALLLTAAGLIFKTASFDASSAGWVSGLLAAAAAVVALAITGMAQSLLKTPWAWLIATVVAVIMVLASTSAIQIVLIGVAAGLGATVLKGKLGESAKGDGSAHLRAVPASVAYACLIAFFVLLAGLWLLATVVGGWFFTRVNAFYQAGALVFGGGHVVLPLLETQFVEPGWVDHAEFISGYSLAQAVPGPMFTFASYLGAVDGGLLGAILGTIVIFIPGTLLMVVGLHFWSRWQASAKMRSVFAAINAAVVGLLAAAFIDPILLHGITGWLSALLALACWVAIRFAKAPAWAVALGAALIGAVIL